MSDLAGRITRARTHACGNIKGTIVIKLRRYAKDTDMNREELGNIMTVRTKPAGLLIGKSNGHCDDEGESKMEPHVGLEFDSAEEAQEFYSDYATQVGFKIRIGQLYRSRVDGAVISRRFVCSKEGFQTNARTGCPAFIRVQKVDSGKWVLANIKNDHNHELEVPGEICPPQIQRKSFPTPRSSAGGASRTGIRSHEEDGLSGVVDIKRLKKEDVGGIAVPIGEPYKGLEFNSADEAYKFYNTFAAITGFKVRIGQLFRSKHDGSITSRRFVCSKEGHQHPSRVGCGAYMRIQRQESGRWVVDRLQKEHNHEFDSPTDPSRRVTVASKGYREEGSSGLENLDLVETNGGLSLVKRVRESNGAFFAGIPVDGSLKSYFSPLLTAQTPLDEFVVRYEKALEQRREEERKEDFNSFNIQAVLHTKDPIEEQCRRLYTITMFKVFQKELLECYSYVGIKINVEGAISRYLARFEAGGSQDFKPLMFWSLREEARNFIEAGAASLERYKLAFEIMQEGRRSLCWQN
ncbi:unnamed protein product [Fraxinus pennsylvanica]|uniref:FAR1 domain-containing protein n=1 Tax=Fraxinus pennsylvanica TaxID=56036 RepID=A0AAD2E3V2_9LAMI|nr:unnamed protein product [Fraxinus pennsylvanica]